MVEEYYIVSSYQELMSRPKAAHKLLVLLIYIYIGSNYMGKTCYMVATRTLKSIYTCVYIVTLYLYYINHR